MIITLKSGNKLSSLFTLRFGRVSFAGFWGLQGVMGEGEIYHREIVFVRLFALAAKCVGASFLRHSNPSDRISLLSHYFSLKVALFPCLAIAD
jgi:hypothetical protein